MSNEDVQKLAERLDLEPEYETLELETALTEKDLFGARRYRVGDRLRVPRTGGGFSLGIVTRIAPSGLFTILLRADNGSIKFKDLSPDAVEAHNPLKIGDYVEVDQAPFWIAGLDGEGDILVLSRTGHRVDPKAFRKRLEERLEDVESNNVTVRLRPVDRQATLQALRRTPTQPIPVARPLDKSPYVPIESIFNVNTSLGLVAGNRETDTVYQLLSPYAAAALHTNRGHNYKSWNEDGGALFADGRGRVYVGVFDQAGGMGTDSKARGAASAIAAQAFFDEMQRVAELQGDLAEGEQALIRAAHKAHRAILERKRGEVTTFIGGMVEHDEALIVNIGDSGALHFRADGTHKESTSPQGVGVVLLQGLGMPNRRELAHQTYRWALERDDFLVFGSDGLLDSRLSTEEIGEMLSETERAADATRKLRDVVSSRMKSRKGKPDNLTVVVLRVGESANEGEPG